MRQWALALAAVVGTMGCGFIKIVPAEKPETTLGRVSYNGPECAAGAEGNGGEGRRDLVLRRICRDQGDKGGRVVDIHHSFDDRRPDPIVAAIFVFDVARMEERPLQTGIASYYAGVLDPAKLKTELTKLDLSERAQEAFYEAAITSKERVVAGAAKLDPRRKHMYVDAPGAAIAKRNEYFAQHAAAYQKLDALEERAQRAKASRSAPADVVAGLTALRSEYFAKCADDSCRFEPLPIEVTRELVSLYLVTNDPILTHAESSLLKEPAAGRHLFSVETGRAIYEAMAEERRDAEKYEAAKRENVDEATLTARFGSPPPLKVDPENEWVGHLPDASRLVELDRQKAQFQSGVVARTADTDKKNERGERLQQVVFKDIVSKEDVSSCYETGKITGISWDSSNHAHVNYEHVCTTVGQKTNVEKVAPVFVPAEEGKRLKAGETLLSLVTTDGRIGVVVQAYVNDKSGKQVRSKVLQVRGERIGS